MAGFFKDHDPYVNALIFPAPTPPTYAPNAFADGELLWLPPAQCARENQRRFPCLWINHAGATHVMLFMHGNAEDLGLLYEQMHICAIAWNMHVLVVEYPGYGPCRYMETATENGCNRCAPAPDRRFPPFAGGRTALGEDPDPAGPPAFPLPLTAPDTFRWPLTS